MPMIYDGSNSCNSDGKSLKSATTQIRGNILDTNTTGTHIPPPPQQLQLQQTQQQHHFPRQFIPRLKSPSRKVRPIDGNPSKLKQLLEHQEQIVTKFSHQKPYNSPYLRTTNSVDDRVHQQRLKWTQQRPAHPNVHQQQHRERLSALHQQQSEALDLKMKSLRALGMSQQHSPGNYLSENNSQTPLQAQSQAQLLDALWNQAPAGSSGDQRHDEPEGFSSNHPNLQPPLPVDRPQSPRQNEIMARTGVVVETVKSVLARNEKMWSIVRARNSKQRAANRNGAAGSTTNKDDDDGDRTDSTFVAQLKHRQKLGPTKKPPPTSGKASSAKILPVSGKRPVAKKKRLLSQKPKSLPSNNDSCSKNNSLSKKSIVPVPRKQKKCLARKLVPAAARIPPASATLPRPPTKFKTSTATATNQSNTKAPPPSAAVLLPLATKIITTTTPAAESSAQSPIPSAPLFQSPTTSEQKHAEVDLSDDSPEHIKNTPTEQRKYMPLMTAKLPPLAESAQAKPSPSAKTDITTTTVDESHPTSIPNSSLPLSEQIEPSKNRTNQSNSNALLSTVPIAPAMEDVPATTTTTDMDLAASVLMNLSLAPDPTNLYPVGTKTKKFFESLEGWFMGTIRSYNIDTKFYSVEYEDGDREDLEHNEIDTGSLPRHKYDIGQKYEVYFMSKETRDELGWYVGTIQSKYYYQPKPKRGRPPIRRYGWRYNVVYSDGDSEDASETYISELIEAAKSKRGKLEISRKCKTKTTPTSPGNNSAPSSSSGDLSEDDESDDDSSDDDEDDDDDDDDQNPDKAPYWTGKQHHQFVVGLKQYGLGNLEDIHEAECIPGRSFQELSRYWSWYSSDLEEKGFVFNYEARGTVNGKPGRRRGDDEDEKQEGVGSSDEDRNGDGYRLGLWTAQEMKMCAKAFAFQGSSYKAMSQYMKTRSPKQIAKYFNTNKRKITALSKEYIQQGADDDDGSGTPGRSKRPWTPGEMAALVDAILVYGSSNKTELAAYMKSRTATQIGAYLKRKGRSLQKTVDAKRLPIKRSNAWSKAEMSRLAEGHAIFGTNVEKIAAFVKSRDAKQVESLLEANASQLKDESAFDLGDRFAFSLELFHILNIASFEGFEEIVSWNDDGTGVTIRDEDKFASLVFPRYSHKGTSVEKFYDNLKLFGFERTDNGSTYHHPDFQRENYGKVEQLCRKTFRSI